jgi:hypothetical protein
MTRYDRLRLFSAPCSPLFKIKIRFTRSSAGSIESSGKKKKPPTKIMMLVHHQTRTLQTICTDGGNIGLLSVEYHRKTLTKIMMLKHHQIH